MRTKHMTGKVLAALVFSVYALAYAGQAAAGFPRGMAFGAGSGLFLKQQRDNAVITGAGHEVFRVQGRRSQSVDGLSYVVALLCLDSL